MSVRLLLLVVSVFIDLLLPVIVFIVWFLFCPG